MIKFFDNGSVGTGKATITYQNVECETQIAITATKKTTSLLKLNYGASAHDGDGFLAIAFTPGQGAVALGEVNAGPSAINGKTIGDLITVDGQTVNALIKSNKIARINFYGDKLLFHVDGAANQTWMANKVIEILPGFQWLTYSQDHYGIWGDLETPKSYYGMENTVVLEKLTFQDVEGKVSKPIEEISVNSTEHKTVYNKGDAIDLSNLTIGVKYAGETEIKTINVTEAMAEYDFTDGGKKNVTITYGGKTTEFEVTVNDKSYTAISIKNKPTKLVYDWGKDFELDLSGAAVTATLHDNVNNTDETVNLDGSLLSYKGYNANVLGKQTVKVVYSGFETEFEVEVKNISEDAYAYLIPDSGASYEKTQYYALKIAFGFSNGVNNYKTPALWNVSSKPNVTDHIYINGLRADYLLKTKIGTTSLLSRINQYGKDLIFNMDNSFLQPTSNKDLAPDYIKWTEGKSTVVTEVLFKAGMQFYYAPSDSWGTDGGIDTYLPIPGGILKEDILLVNLNGQGWVRKLATNVYGVTDESAIEFKLPTKLTYKVGDSKLDIAGASLTVHYEDGGTEKIAISANSFKGFDSSEAGVVDIRYNYNGNIIRFQVTIEEEKTDTSESGSGSSSSKNGCGNITLAAALLSLSTLLGAAFIIKKR